MIFSIYGYEISFKAGCQISKYGYEILFYVGCHLTSVDKENGSMPDIICYLTKVYNVVEIWSNTSDEDKKKRSLNQSKPS